MQWNAEREGGRKERLTRFNIKCQKQRSQACTVDLEQSSLHRASVLKKQESKK